MSKMELALSFIDKNNTSKFKNMEDLIHIDEKWFYLTKDRQRFIMAADKAEPYRHVQHKSFLTKIMFLCAVARPRYDMNKNAWFDGKNGIWPIGKWEPVKWSSKKCTKGMPVWKNQCITRDVYCEYLIQKLLLLGHDQSHTTAQSHGESHTPPPHNQRSYLKPTHKTMGRRTEQTSTTPNVHAVMTPMSQPLGGWHVTSMTEQPRLPMTEHKQSNKTIG